MENNHLLTYDGSFKGFLTAVYTGLSQKLSVSGIAPAAGADAGSLFEKKIHIPTKVRDALRLWDALGKSGADTQRYVYYAFLSERIEIQHDIYSYIYLLFRDKSNNSWDRRFELRERLSPWAHRVGKEKRHLEANMRFRLLENGLHYGCISPVYNVLPLLSKYCRNRFREGNWLVHDENRNQVLFNQQDGVMITRSYPALTENETEGTQELPSTVHQFQPNGSGGITNNTPLPKLMSGHSHAAEGTSELVRKAV